MKFVIVLLATLTSLLIVNGSSGENYASSAELLNNLTGTCAERTITVSASSSSPYSTRVDNTVRAFRATFFSLLTIFSLSFNFFVVYLIAKYKKLHTLSFSIALQVIIMDILIPPIVMFPILVTTSADGWVLGSQTCAAVGYLSFLLISTRTNMMLVLVMDRFLSVFLPYLYRKHKVKTAICLSALSWVFIISVNSLALPGILDCFGFLASFQTCFSTQTCSEACGINGLVYFASVDLPTVIIPVVLYTILYFKARSLRNNTSTSPIITEEERRSQRRATVTYFLLFVSLVAVVVPSSVTQAVITQLFSNEHPPAGLHIAQVVAGAFSFLFVLTDPIVIMRHGDVREIILELKARVVQNIR